ncbi:MAG: hypothetical protein KC441_06880 [Anaerolineales bacterium]|nr:hypothetical protein [Anaerolineales bacterium]
MNETQDMTPLAAQLRQMLTTYFSEDELLILCFDLNVDSESFPGEGKTRLVVELIQYMARNGRLPELIQACQQRRSQVAWEDLLAAAQTRPEAFISQLGELPRLWRRPRQWPGLVWVGVAALLAALLFGVFQMGRSGETPPIGTLAAALPTPTYTPAKTPSPAVTAVVATPTVTTTAIPTIPPGVLAIPRGETAVVIDGLCDETGEYRDAFSETYPDQDAKGQVFFKHDGEHFYACVKAPVGNFDQRFFALNFAPDNGTADEVAEFNAHPVSGRADANPVQSGWTARVTISDSHESAEFRIPMSAINVAPCTAVFRLTVFHYWVTGVGRDYNWPNGLGAGFGQPAIWRRALLQDC